jgi:hypothetical protein
VKNGVPTLSYANRWALRNGCGASGLRRVGVELAQDAGVESDTAVDGAGGGVRGLERRVVVLGLLPDLPGLMDYAGIPLHRDTVPTPAVIRWGVDRCLELVAWTAIAGEAVAEIVGEVQDQHAGHGHHREGADEQENLAGTQEGTSFRGGTAGRGEALAHPNSTPLGPGNACGPSRLPGRTEPAGHRLCSQP